LTGMWVAAAVTDRQLDQHPGINALETP
jgi:uncharacterized protein YneF (UPF0154 family)